VVNQLRVTSSIYSRHVDVVEGRSLSRLPGVRNEISPGREVLLFGADVILVNSISVREHRFNISNLEIKFSARLFLKGSTNRPDEGKHEDLLNIGHKVSSISLRSLNISSPNRVVKLSEVLDARRFRGLNKLFAGSLLSLKHFRDILNNQILKVLFVFISLNSYLFVFFAINPLCEQGLVA